MVLKNISQIWNFINWFLLGPVIKDLQILNYELTIQTLARHNINILYFLQKNSATQLKTLIDIAVYDEPTKQNRFTIVYLLLSTQFNYRLQIFFKTSHLTPVPSITNLFKAAIWAEREIWDLYGIFFIGHEDLRRILTDYNFQGHALRKDFPLSGYTDIFYDDKKKRLVYAPIEIAQESRDFSFQSPWK